MKNIWAIGLTIFFVGFVSGIVSFVVWSLGQRQDLVATDYYDQEVRYQDRIDAIARVEQEGLKPGVTYDAAAATLKVAFERPESLQSATGTVTLYRPSSAAMDRSVSLQPDASGIQLITGSLASGLWRVRTEWFKGGATYFAETAVVVP